MSSQLNRLLNSLDGKGYSAYKSIKGSYDLRVGRLSIDRVQSDPYAPPSLMQVTISRAVTGISDDLISDDAGRIAVADFVMRRAAGRAVDSAVHVGHPIQVVMERTNVVITKSELIIRCAVALPAAGRRIKGRSAARLLCHTLPAIIDYCLDFDTCELAAHVALVRDQEFIRAQLARRNLVAFVGNGAVLPRRSGDSDLPLGSGAVPFVSPESLAVSVAVPSGKTVTGMGIPAGVTVIVGGGYHGKSTLLRAIERGVYNHIRGDGREWVISRADATAVRAEDGRAVTGVDISPFISNLPSGVDTRWFSTTNASGSTSQAANVMEAVAAGASTLLIDEDTSATNFMIRDSLMQQLIPADDEPITPFAQRVRPLCKQLGVSTIVVAGGSGAFFEKADLVIAMNAYVPRDVTDQAHAIAGGSVQIQEASISDFTARPRIPARGGLQAPDKRKPAKALRRSEIRYGKDTIDLSGLIQLIDASQTTGIAHALDWLAARADGTLSVTALVDSLFDAIAADGLAVIAPHNGHPGLFARPRRQDVIAAVNRYRGLKLVR
ncbi:putative ATPase of the ABC class [Corynebacterium mustelae]|uniref:Putative ATPase of the ABC class n=1 Tax=Corynebacterium mustelae TaxID=571915 RepID=A0A0G3H0C8_9CORY|nr:ABC-ATPase domain-containing protein [Corynebacterium mustelae]AKK06864.1 putative ATPase of the ABC class [Corynebacterium mustelae]